MGVVDAVKACSIQELPRKVANASLAGRVVFSAICPGCGCLLDFEMDKDSIAGRRHVDLNVKCVGCSRVFPHRAFVLR